MVGRLLLPCTASCRFSGSGCPRPRILYARIWARSCCSWIGLKEDGPRPGCGSMVIIWTGGAGGIWGGVGPLLDMGLGACSGTPMGEG